MHVSCRPSLICLRDYVTLWEHSVQGKLKKDFSSSPNCFNAISTAKREEAKAITKKTKIHHTFGSRHPYSWNLSTCFWEIHVTNKHLSIRTTIGSPSIHLSTSATTGLTKTNATCNILESLLTNSLLPQHHYKHSILELFADAVLELAGSAMTPANLSLWIIFPYCEDLAKVLPLLFMDLLGPKSIWAHL